MRQVHIAAIFDQPIYAGGGHQQALNAALQVMRLRKYPWIKLSFYTNDKKSLPILRQHGIEVSYLGINILDAAIAYLRRHISEKHIYRIIHHILGPTKLESRLLSEGITLAYFLSPSSWAFDLDSLNYITTVWDLCHLDHPEFPEVRIHRQFEHRQKILNSILPKASAIIVDSESLAYKVRASFLVDPQRIHIVPFQPAQCVQTFHKLRTPGSTTFTSLENLSLHCPYVFYPAQFWPHKNHVYILDGLLILEQSHNLEVGAIFTGSDKGNMTYIKNYAKKLGIADRVLFPGFVDEKFIVPLYMNSICLVMPTFFGPTNLPPLEAFALGVPVIYPDLPGLRDQVADASLLVDLTDPSSLSTALNNLLTHTHIRENLVSKGYNRLEELLDPDLPRSLTKYLLLFSRKMNAFQ